MRAALAEGAAAAFGDLEADVAKHLGPFAVLFGGELSDQPDGGKNAKRHSKALLVVTNEHQRSRRVGGAAAPVAV